MEISIGPKVRSHPAISIIIPHYNSADYIAETLDSVFSQSFSDFEVIVVNDGSPDSSRLYSAIEPYRDRIVFIDKPENEGASTARNLGVEHARGDLFSFLDSDDIWFPTFLEELSAFLSSTDFDMVYADAEKFLEVQNQKIGDFLPFNPPQGEVTRAMCVAGQCHLFVASGALLKRSVFETVGRFDPEVSRTEDFDFAMRLLSEGFRIGYLRKVLFTYRLRPGSYSGDSIVRHERNVLQWRILQKKLDFTDEENVMVEGHIKSEEAAILRAKGRMYLERGDWRSAKEMFRSARLKAAELGLPTAHKLRLTAVLTMLSLWPSALRYLFRRFRRDEIDFMPEGS